MSSYRVIGLTGGVASGKSVAAKFLAEAGYPVVDADEIARALRSPGGAAHDKIAARFGTAESGKLRSIVFADASARKDLEAILHPLIVAESTKRLAEAGDKSPLVFYEAALLIETGRHRGLDGLIVIDSTPLARKERLVRRDGISPELATRMLASQIGDEERRRAATHVVVNDGTLDDLRSRILQVAAELARALQKQG